MFEQPHESKRTFKPYDHLNSSLMKKLRSWLLEPNQGVQSSPEKAAFVEVEKKSAGDIDIFDLPDNSRKK